MANITPSLITNIIISSITITFTLFIIIMFQRRKDLLRKVPNRILCSMVVCELLKSLMLTFHVSIEVFADTFNRPDCHWCIVFAILVDVATSFLTKVFILHLCAMVFERRLAVTRALFFETIFTGRFVKKMLALIWAIPAVMSAVQFAYLYPYLLWIPEQMDSAWIALFEIVYALIAFILFTVIPSIGISVAYIHILVEIRRIQEKQKKMRINLRASIRRCHKSVIIAINSNSKIPVKNNNTNNNIPVKNNNSSNIKTSIGNIKNSNSLDMKKSILKKSGVASLTIKPELRAAICLLLIFICFMGLSLPYFLLRLYVDFMIWLEEEITLSPLVFNVLYTLKNFTSLVNAVVFIVMNREVRNKTVSFLF